MFGNYYIYNTQNVNKRGQIYVVEKLQQKKENSQIRIELLIQKTMRKIPQNFWLNSSGF